MEIDETQTIRMLFSFVVFRVTGDVELSRCSLFNDKIELDGDLWIVVDYFVLIPFSEGCPFSGFVGVGAKMEKVFVSSVLGIFK